MDNVEFNYLEERLKCHEAQLKLAKIGVKKVVLEQLDSENFSYEEIELYINAIKDLKASVDIYKKQIEKEKDKKNEEPLL